MTDIETTTQPPPAEPPPTFTFSGINPAAATLPSKLENFYPAPLTAEAFLRRVRTLRHSLKSVLYEAEHVTFSPLDYQHLVDATAELHQLLDELIGVAQ